MKDQTVVTRFPPSPTGFLHLGGARTALFNWLFARHHGGKFILRIEDTDQARSTEAATRAILDSLAWLGLDWDEGPYFQSKRYYLYNALIDRLLASGEAYYCHCSPEELEKKRETAMALGLKPKYDRKCRELNLGPGAGAVVRLKSPIGGTTQFHDLVKGPIRFDNEELDDLILRRSDGSPTYHMAVVADDITLGVTHVIRGDDHVNNTPRQMAIYRSLGESLPQYAHVPMILGSDKTRLSKRHGAASVLEYRELGYLPQALLNALVRIGWSHGDQEKFTVEELIAKFSLESVGKSAGVFNAEKFLDLNAWYIRESPDADLATALIPFLDGMGTKGLKAPQLLPVVALLKPRSKTLVEMAEKAAFFFQDSISCDPEAEQKFLTRDILPRLEDIRNRLSDLMVFDQGTLERAFELFLAQNDLKLKAVAQPLRLALTGKTASPGLFEVMAVLGKDKVLGRIDSAIDRIRART
jgi:glutamyl-tRNA synthetase